ncbi:2OG-Fe(II) oxygenase family oxidoreductase [Bisporella sp. PMI_857]|nr:2OG-Fe(II) oxygenase family oxidoreductase [Bisporella sp. PMI_857]
MDTRLKWAIILVPLAAVLYNILNIGEYVFSIAEKYGLWDSTVLKNVPGNVPFQCQLQPYTIEILSIDAFIVYINNFLSDAEIDYLLEWSGNRFNTALTLNEDGKLVPDPNTATLAVTLLRSDVVSECLTKRMKSFLGNVQHIDTEPIRIVKYKGGDKIPLHTDWVPQTRNKTWNPAMPHRPNNRLGSIFAYLEDDCDGGETYFPNVQGVSEDADGEKFSTTESGFGLLVKPRRGNAVFWNNLHSNGSGDSRTAHAGMPVRRGTKIGINIWSHYFFDAPMIG